MEYINTKINLRKNRKIMALNSMILTFLWLISQLQMSQGSLQEDALKVLLNSRKFELPNSQIITFRELYGVSLTPDMFRPGGKFLLFLQRTQETVPKISIAKTQLPPLPTALMTNHVSPQLGWGKLIFVHGGPRSGKTTALQIIKNYFDQNRPMDFTIFVDLPTAAAAKRKTMETLTIDDILKHSVNEDFIGLIKNIAQVNPSKIRFLLDGVDQAPHAQDKILSLVSDLHEMQVNIIMTSCNDLKSALELKKLVPTTFDIPSAISNGDLLEFTTKYWTQQMKFRRQRIFPELINEYSKIFRIMIQETPLPRTFEIMRRMASYITDLDMPFPNIFKYTSERVINRFEPTDVIKQADEMKFEKMKFYNDFFNHLNPIIEVYGPYALTMILERPKSSKLHDRVETAKELLKIYGENAFKFMLFKNGVPVDFVHNEYKRYFAAKYIMDSFISDKPLIKTLEKIMINPKYVFLLEFIDSEIFEFEGLHGDKLMKTWNPKFSQHTAAIMDNLIQHRLDNLCYKIFDSLDVEDLRAYLGEANLLKSKNKYSFGMLSDPEFPNAREYVPRKTRWIFSGTRSEMILNLEMSNAVGACFIKGYTLDPSVYLIYYAKQGEIQYINFMQSHGHELNSIELLNRAVFEALSSLGEESYRILEDLIRRGAVLQDVRVDGRTILHAAVEWRNVHLIEKVVRYLEDAKMSVSVGPDNFGRSVLSTALDTNPVTTRTQEGFWEMMSYLVQHFELLDGINLIFDDLRQFSPSPHEMPRIFQVLLIGGPEEEHANAVEIMERYVPLVDLDISPQVLATRRLLVMRNCVNQISRFSLKTNFPIAVTDILVQYRGVDEFNSESEAGYRDSITHSLIKEGKHFNALQRNRIFTAITKNIIYKSEWNVMRQIFTDVVLPKLEVRWAFEVYSIFQKRMENQIPRINIETIETQVLATRSDFHPNLENDVPMVIEALVFSGDDGYQSSSSICNID